MDAQVIKVVIGEQKLEVTVRYDLDKRVMTFSEADNFNKVYREKDIYACFAKVRTDFPHIVFLCKGAKIKRYAIEDGVSNECRACRL